MKLTVSQSPDGTFDVIDESGAKLCGGFATNAAAWGWIDRTDNAAMEDEERRRRIQTSFAEQ